MSEETGKSFAAALNAYCEMLPCTAVELASACGISPSALSRYRSGQRTPTSQSKAIAQLASGIASMMAKYQVNGALSENDIAVGLSGARLERQAAASLTSARLDALMTALDLSNAEVASIAGVDASYVSRIRHGKREPHDRMRFSRHCVALAANKLMRDNSMDILPRLDGISESDVASVLATPDHRLALMDLLINWLVGTRLFEAQSDDILLMLESINVFDYPSVCEMLMSDAYWDEPCNRLRSADDGDAESMHADSRFYYGLQGGREAELAFFGEALAADELGTMIINSNVASMELAADEDFAFHHQSGMMRFLQCGGHVDVIHNMRRPFAEILAGFRYWLPLYLTGRVGAYYFDEAFDAAVKTGVSVARSCALSVEDITGKIGSRQSHVVTLPSEVEHCRMKAKALLRRAKPVFDLYRLDNPAQRRKCEEGRAMREAAASGMEVAAGRFDSLRIVSYPGSGSVIWFLREPKVCAVMRHPRMNQIISHLDELLDVSVR